MHQENSGIILNKRIKGGYFCLIFKSHRIARGAAPGQFLEIKIPGTENVFLRRPFSIHSVDRSGRISILYEVLGKGTKVLSGLMAGASLNIIGPLGSGFTYPTTDNRQPATILVAGGMGVAPLFFLAEKIRKFQIANPESRTLVLIGAKTKNHILCEKEFKKLGCSVKIATDNGSRGFKGKVTDLLKHLLLTIGQSAAKRSHSEGGRPSAIYSCGPHPMLKGVAAIANKYNIPSQSSLEAHMACGIGACMGCVVKTKNHSGYKRVCKDGPVFDSDEIAW